MSVKLAATLAIHSRIEHNYEKEDDKPPTSLELVVTDKTSRSNVVTIRVSADALVAALARHGDQPIEVVYSLDLLGKVREHKVEIVPGLSTDDVSVRLKGFEVDGWVARRDDLVNSHKCVATPDGPKGHQVVFVRYVYPEAE